MENLIIACVLLLISAVFLTLSFFSFKQKGFLMNNAYIYATKDERNSMHKKPYYLQSAIIFLLLGTVFILNAAAFLSGLNWLYAIATGVVLITIIYAIISTVIINKQPPTHS